jgi:hypothetical protein
MLRFSFVAETVKNSRTEKQYKEGKNMFDPKSRIAIVFACVVLIAFTVPALAVEYNPGVIAGEWVKYGHFVASGLGVPSDFNQSDWMKITVTAVSGNNVTLHMSGKYKNGTATNESDTIYDVETGWTNVTTGTYNVSSFSYGFFFITATNLTENDPLLTASVLKINKTETRTYLGEDRTVNIVNITTSIPGFYDFKYVTVYDKASGMLLETTMLSNSTLMPSTDMQMSFSIIQTSIFGVGTGEWFQDLRIWTGIAVVIIIVIALIIVLTRPKQPPTKTP